MEFIETPIMDCFVINPNVYTDQRGLFTKIFNESMYKQRNLASTVKEVFYTKSKKRALRGLHFQTPPKAQAKIVTCLRGKVFDAVVDLRKSSPTYKQHFTIELSDENHNAIFVPAGLAHGYYVLSDEAITLYTSNEEYFPEQDSGILWNSIGIEWPDEQPVLSERDSKLAPFHSFNNPF